MKSKTVAAWSHLHAIKITITAGGSTIQRGSPGPAGDLQPSRHMGPLRPATDNGALTVDQDADEQMKMTDDSRETPLEIDEHLQGLTQTKELGRGGKRRNNDDDTPPRLLASTTGDAMTSLQQHYEQM